MRKVIRILAFIVVTAAAFVFAALAVLLSFSVLRMAITA